MAAAAFKANMTWKGAGGVHLVQCTVSDVNAEYYVSQAGDNDFTLPTNMGQVLYLTDVILAPAGGTDTTTGSIFVNGKDTGVKVINGANLATNLNRQFNQAPLAVAAGARIKIKQNT